MISSTLLQLIVYCAIMLFLNLILIQFLILIDDHIVLLAFHLIILTLFYSILLLHMLTDMNSLYEFYRYFNISTHNEYFMMY